MPLRRHIHELKAALGSRAEIRRKSVDAARTLRTLFDRDEQLRRIRRLQELDGFDEVPTTWQIWVGAHHMLTRFLLPSNEEFYEHYAHNHWWAQVLRVLDEPSAMLDPTGLAISRDMLISHLLQVVHTSAGYDVELLRMFPDGLDELERQLRQLIAGEHPRQQGIEAILERDDYPQALLDALEAYRADPRANWPVYTGEAPEGCETRFDWGVEVFGTPTRFLRYCATLPASPWRSLTRPVAGARPPAVAAA